MATDLFDEDTMTDAAAEPEAEAETEDTEKAEAPAAEASPKKSKRPAVPEGCVTPVGFATVLKEQRDKEYATQHIYGWLRTSKTIPTVPLEGYALGVIPVKEGLEWFDALQERKVAAAAKKSAKAATEAAAAAPKTDES